MRTFTRSRRSVTGLVALATLLTLVAGAGFFNTSALAASPDFTAHRITVQPQFHKLTSAQSVGKNASVTDFCLTNFGVPCYSPQQIRKAYDIQNLLNFGNDGRGRSIVIVDAYQSPTIKADLKYFDSYFGLPDPAFQIVAPDGMTPWDGNDLNQAGWSLEITLDVEWAHAVAPGAKIVLVLAKSNEDADILSATEYAIDHNLGDVISQSFGEAESCVDPDLMNEQHRAFQAAVNKGITLFASAGDNGAAQPSCDGTGLLLSASSPASDPLVTGVGGTTLAADSTTGAYQSETAWNGSGGGFSTVYGRPSFQLGVPGIGRHRGVPDVAYDADPNSGVVIFQTLPQAYGGDGSSIYFLAIGGTSAGSPQWAGLGAIADQIAHRRLGNINPALYDLGEGPFTNRLSFHDITSGNNIQSGIGGYSTAKGWDAVTGWGSPKAQTLIPALIAASH